MNPTLGKGHCTKKTRLLFCASLLTLLTLWLTWSCYIPEEKITLSFYQETTAPVHFACWYKTSETEDFSPDRLIYNKKAPLQGVLNFEIPTKHLHDFKLAILPLEENTNISIRDLKITAGEIERTFSDLNSLTFYLPKSFGIKKEGSQATWRGGQQSIGKITPKKPVDISLPLNINWSLLLLSAWASLSGWYVVLSLLNRLYKKRKQIADAYTYRATSAQTGRFESHLEGLRGLAILLVLVFHLGTTGVRSPITLNGGFLGVEMFLVLSGYLLLLGFCRKHEGPLTFIRKKLLRIMLPVSVLILLTMACCLWCMDFEDLVNMAQNAWYALLGCVNIHLSANGAEYFSSDQAFNPLLHMWYVAITLQLYLVLYIGYLLIWPLHKWLKIFILAVFAGISYTWGNCHALRADVVAALDLPLWMTSEGTMYYSTFARLWEAILGMGILLLPVSRNKVLSSVLSSMAIVGIVLCVWLLPPHAMLLTASATALLIRYGNAGFVSGILNHKYIRFIGKISFSIYLVHMPLFVCYKCSTFSSLSYPEAILLLLVSIALGWCFWWLVEKRQIPAWCGLIIWLCAMGVAHLLIQTDGLKEYWNKDINSINYKRYNSYRFKSDKQIRECYNSNQIKHFSPGSSIIMKMGENIPKISTPFLQIGHDNEEPSFVLIGDSHSYMTYPGLDVICQEAGISGIQLHTLLIPIWDRNYGVKGSAYSLDKNKIISFLHWLEKHPELQKVVICFSWNRFRTDYDYDWEGQKKTFSEADNIESMKVFLKKLKSIKKEVIVYTPYPRFKAKDCGRYARKRCRLGLETKHLDEYSVTLEEHNKQYDLILNTLKQWQAENLCSLLDVAPYFFRNGVFHAVNNNSILFFDDNHFSAEVSIGVARFLQSEFLKVMKKQSE